LVAVLLFVNQHEMVKRRAAEMEREQSVEKLREAFAKVKQLSGLLAICAACKKIRDENSRWHLLETYIRDRSEADFTHGICPECRHRLYPEIIRT